MFVLRNCLHSLDNCKQVCITLVYSQFSQQSRICFLNYPLTVDRTRSQRDAVILTERERSLSSRHGGLTNSVFSVCCILPQFLTLVCWLVFVFKSFYLILFMTEKYAKGPGTGLVSRMKLCSWVRDITRSLHSFRCCLDAQNSGTG